MPTNPYASANSPWGINAAVPGLSGLTNSASGIIGNALNGLPSPSESRLQNAWYGSASGMDPTSHFLQNRGYDLYRGRANQQQQQGLQNYFGLLGATSGVLAPTPGQEFQNQQFGQSQAQQNNQFGQNQAQQAGQFNADFGFQQQQWKKQLELLQQYLGPGAGTSGVGSPAGGFNYRG